MKIIPSLLFYESERMLLWYVMLRVSNPVTRKIKQGLI